MTSDEGRADGADPAGGRPPRARPSDPDEIAARAAYASQWTSVPRADASAASNGPPGQPHTGRSGPAGAGSSGARRSGASEPAEQRAALRRTADNDSNAGRAWNVMGTLLAGAGFWGFAGWGVDRLTHLHTVFLPIGLLLGMAAGIYLVIYQAMHR
jgi:F0F1-type ATP synthase assembly protein I